MSWAQSIPSRTLGGSQLWTDYFIYGDYRIQQHAITGHCRLLDDRNVRRASGSYEHCKTRFDAIRSEMQLPKLKHTAVVTVHGLGRSRLAMSGLASFLAEQGDWTSINVEYASTRMGIAGHATALGRIVDNLDGVSRVHFVGHSMGNIIIRQYLAARSKQPVIQSVPTVGRVVMLAAPNNGSAVARILKDNRLFRWFGGASGKQLGAEWDKLQTSLGTPKDFGVIAGSTRDGKGMNPLIEGDDDLIVSVEETRLVGASDFLKVPSIHTFIMDRDDVRQATLEFLKNGYFVAPDKRQPILAAPEDE